MRFGRFDSEEEAGRVALEKAKEYGKSIIGRNVKQLIMI